jgi:hypothetical protein
MVSSFLTGVRCAKVGSGYVPSNEAEETEMNITTVGLDWAKNVFHVVGFDEHGHERVKKRLSRGHGF